MAEPRVLVIGAGPAGLAAAIELAQQGLRVTLIEQRDLPGGAIYRQPGHSAVQALRLSHDHRRNWAELSRGLKQAGERIDQRFECVFIGLDRDGRCLVDDRRAGRVSGLRAQAIIVAVGAVEQVVPRLGWELPGVTSAGGLQVQLKETGEAPNGPVLIAGSGPLLLALAAQLTEAGQPPVAVLERGQPWQALTRYPTVGWGLLTAAHYLREALAHGSRLLRAGVPYRTGWEVERISATEGGLAVSCRHANGDTAVHQVRHLALHDGLQTNHTGLPTQPIAGLLVERAGDCREVLGAHAAMADGRRVAQRVAAQLRGAASTTLALDRRVATERRAQAALQTLLRAPAPTLTDDTVVCRCEGLRLRDLHAFNPACSAKELKLNGRFGMGACQGRFCHRAVSEHLKGHPMQAPEWREDEVLRWPLRPVSVAALAAYEEPPAS